MYLPAHDHCFWYSKSWPNLFVQGKRLTRKYLQFYRSLRNTVLLFTTTQLAFMSRRNWSSTEDRRKLHRIDRIFRLVLQRAHVHNIGTHDLYYNDSDSEDSFDYDDLPPLINPYIDSLRDLVPIANQQHERVHGGLEEDGITFNETKVIDDFSESDCHMYFRFLKNDLIDVAIQLWPRLSPYLDSVNPARIEVGDRYIAHYETCFCLYLYKMSYPSRLRCDCERFFGLRKSKLSRMLITFGNALYQLSMKYLSSPTIWHSRMPYYAAVIREKCGGLFPHMWGFVDCTIRQTCRPTYNQEAMYTRYKRCHGLKFQSVVTPVGR